MARKPPSWRQRLLFPSDPSDSPEPQGQVVSHPEGSEHAVQDHPSSYAAGVRAVRRQPSLFDDLPPLKPAEKAPEPAAPKETPAGPTGPAFLDVRNSSDPAPSHDQPTSLIASGEKAKARDILAA